jgi:tRNA-guanine family transglycosylase
MKEKISFFAKWATRGGEYSYAKFWKEGILNKVLVSAIYAKERNQNLREFMNADKNVVIFLDSGGFTILRKKLMFDPVEILRFQENSDVNIASTLDYPLSPSMSYHEKLRRVQKTIDNAILMLKAKRNDDLKLYASIHAWDFRSAKIITSKLSNYEFDGLAIGSLVPIRSNYSKIVEIICSVKSYLKKLHDDKKIHCFGFSGIDGIFMAGLLGVDSFDSTTYLTYAKYRHYILPQTGQRICLGLNVKTEKRYILDELPCNCPICKKYSAEDFIQNTSKAVGLLSLHNLYVLTSYVKLINNALKNRFFGEIFERRLSLSPRLRNAWVTFQKLNKDLPSIRKIDDYLS